MHSYVVSANQKQAHQRDDKAYVRSASKLERAALTPVVTGELIHWVRDVTDALRVLRAAWSIRARRRRELEREIARLDPALCHRVVMLADRARHQHNELETLVETINAIRHALERGAAEATNLEEIWQARDRLICWSVTVRVLDAELDTCFAESVYRDRGVVD